MLPSRGSTRRAVSLAAEASSSVPMVMVVVVVQWDVRAMVLAELEVAAVLVARAMFSSLQ